MSTIEIFCCYARKDQQLLNNLKIHLLPLQRQGLIAIWNDTDISPGAEWEEEINKHLNTADIILLLISPDFMASDYCYSKEMQRALERHEHGDARVIPIILRSVYWQGAPFGKLQALPKDGKPVLSRHWHNKDEAFFSVVEGIRKAVEVLSTKPQVKQPNEIEETTFIIPKEVAWHQSIPSARKAFRTMFIGLGGIGNEVCPGREGISLHW